MPVLILWLALSAAAQVPPASGKPVPPSFAELDAVFRDSTASRAPSEDALAGAWKLEAEARDPEAKDRLPVLMRLLGQKLDERAPLFGELEFEKLKVSFPIGLLADSKIKPRMLVECLPRKDAAECETSLSYRQHDDEGFITILKLRWKLEFRRFGDKLLARIAWKYAVWHQCPTKGPYCPLAAIPFGEPLKLDETASRLSLYSRTPSSSSAPDRRSR
jgi:hypothetical protein